MTQEDIDAIVGRTRRELREAKLVLGALNAKSGQIREFVDKLSRALKTPAGIIIDNQSYESEYVPMGSTALLSTSEFSDLNPASFRELSHEIREQTKKIAVLRKRLIELEGEEE